MTDQVKLCESGKNWRERGRAKKTVGRPTGSHHHNSKLTEEMVRDAIRQNAAGKTCIALAKEMGVSFSALHSAVRGNTWRHVHESLNTGTEQKG